MFDSYFCLADPLFTDPYIRCLLPSDIQMDVVQSLHKHCLATKYIDDKVLRVIEKTDGLNQVSALMNDEGLIDRYNEL